MNQEFKPCPFCGMQSELSWEDTIHQSGEAWREDMRNGVLYRHYIRRNDPRGYHGLCYDINCATVYGGCGVTMDGDSKEEVIEKWNRRFNATQGEKE